ncbi:MAG: diaminopimelate epimerase [Deltaproteobacteria bacterium]|nr:diaminopimelate epimerase [Deltaproteobacteria bacterium]
MNIEFTKMQGLGNDFIVLDLRLKNIPGLPKKIKKLSHRMFGIGFDQALILRASKKADFRMDIYNADGRRVEMCGNGIRCLAMYIWKKKLSIKSMLEIETLAGIIRPEKKRGLARVDMGEAILEGSLIPTRTSGLIVDRPLIAGDREFLVTSVSMGNPHAVIFVDDVGSFPVARYGQLIENDPFFPKRTNVEFVQVLSSKKLRMRVWERGAGETLACGTGACAAAVAANLKGLAGKTVDVLLPGGVLKIEIKDDNRVYMTGPGQEVFEGRLTV